MFHNPMDNRSLYNFFHFMQRTLAPYSDCCNSISSNLNRMSTSINLPLSNPFLASESVQPYSEMFTHSSYYLRKMAAYYYVTHLLTRTYTKPEFNITEVKMGDDYVNISEHVIERKSFCNLLHFKKAGKENQKLPKLLLVAPMSGHHATLLRNTVIDMLPFYDVYITDWKDARGVPLIAGSFDLDEFAQYIISFIQKLGPELHVMAVCQPTVPVLVAVALMSTDNDYRVPRSLILLGGPIDTSKSPTAVNQLATSRGDDWFKQNVISIVPNHYPGAMRLVFPGFMQLSGFINMNPKRHMDSLHEAVENWADNNIDESLKTLRFYEEYFSTMDLTAEFYIQTINSVFQEKLLTKGKYKTRGRLVRLQDITDTAVLAIEGGKDDITGVGQTKSVIGFCKNLSPDMKKYFLAKDVGHFGLFNGSKFRNVILPKILAFTKAHTPVKQPKKPKKLKEQVVEVEEVETEEVV
jgi:poly(3-hydroxybutyrate) depolymerase